IHERTSRNLLMQDQGEPPPGWLHPTLQHTARLPLPTVQRRPSPCARCSIPLLCFFTLRGGVGGNQGPWWPGPSCVWPRPPPLSSTANQIHFSLHRSNLL